MGGRWAQAAAVAVAVGSAAAFQLSAGPDVGLANNGDGGRLMCQADLGEPSVADRGAVLDFRWDPMLAGCGAAGGYQSSWSLVLRPVAALWHLLRADDGFDVRALGIVGVALLAVVFGILCAVLPGRRLRRVSLVAALAAVALDVGFVSYFSSAYSEPAALLGVPLIAATLVGALAARRPGARLAWLAGCLAVTAFVVTAKPAYLPMILCLAVPLVFRPLRPAGRRSLVAFRAAAVAGIGGLVVLGSVYLAGQLVSLSRANAYDVLFYTVLPRSPDPAADLRDMGLPPSLVRYSGTSWWTVPQPALSDPIFVAHADRALDRATTLRFLGRHPGRAVDLLGLSVEAVPHARVGYLSNLLGATDRFAPARLSGHPSPVFAVFSALSGSAIVVLPVTWLGSLLLGGWELHRRRTPLAAVRGLLLLFLSLVALTQVVTSLGDGAVELAKHNIITAYATGLVLAVLLHLAGEELLRMGRRRWGRHRPADAPAEAPAEAMPAGQTSVTRTTTCSQLEV